MAFTTNPYRRKLLSTYSSAGQRTPRGLDRHGDRILIHSGHAFGLHRHAALPVGPHARDLARGNAIAWDVDTVANDTNWFIWFHHLFKLLNTLLMDIRPTTQCHPSCVERRDTAA